MNSFISQLICIQAVVAGEEALVYLHDAAQIAYHLKPSFPIDAMQRFHAAFFIAEALD